MIDSWVTALAPCGACRRVCAFNLARVPSVRLNGARVPICRECFERVNDKRRAIGLEPFPLLDGAYEPALESDIVWNGEADD